VILYFVCLFMFKLLDRMLSRMLKHPRVSICRYGKFIFSLLICMIGLLSYAVKDVEISKPVWEFIFPSSSYCSIGIYFSFACLFL